MIKNSILLTFLVLLLTASFNTLLAQSKEACKPSSCGPSDTKKSEAKAITALRVELQEVIKQLQAVDNNYRTSLGSITIDQGNDDEESLRIIFDATQHIREVVLTLAAESSLIPDLKQKPTSGKTNRELMITSREQVKLLADQAAKLGK